jgi:hypothetical protein
MVRLLAVKASIAALRRAISLSYRLKPATWELLAIFCAALFVLSVWGYEKSQRSRTVPGGGSTISHQVVVDRSGSPIIPRPVAESDFVDLTATRHMAVIVIHSSGPKIPLVDIDPAMRLRMDAPLVSSGMAASTIKPMLFALSLRDRVQASAAVSAEDDVWFAARQSGAIDIPGFLRSLRRGPTVIYQTPPDKDSNPWKAVMFWAPLFGMIVSPLVGLGTLMLSWISLRRKWAEQTLLDLQVLKVQLEIEELRRKREEVLREATKTRILLD